MKLYGHIIYKRIIKIWFRGIMYGLGLVIYSAGCTPSIDQNAAHFRNPPFHDWFVELTEDTVYWVMPNSSEQFDASLEEVQLLSTEQVQVLLASVDSLKLAEAFQVSEYWYQSDVLMYAQYSIVLSPQHTAYVMAVVGEPIDPFWGCWIYDKKQAAFMNYYRLSKGILTSESGYHFEKSCWVIDREVQSTDWFQIHHSYHSWLAMQRGEDGRLQETAEGDILQVFISYDSTHQAWCRFEGTEFVPNVLYGEGYQSTDAYTAVGADTVIAYQRIHLEWNPKMFKDSAEAMRELSLHKDRF